MKSKYFQVLFTFLLILLIGFAAGYLVRTYLILEIQFEELIIRVITIWAISFVTGILARLIYNHEPRVIRIVYGLLAGINSILILDRIFPSSYSLLSDGKIISSLDTGQIIQISSLIVLILVFALYKSRQPDSRVINKKNNSKSGSARTIKTRITSSFSKFSSNISSLFRKKPTRKHASKKSTSGKSQASPKKVNVKRPTKTKSPPLKINSSSTKKRKSSTSKRKKSKNEQGVKLVGREDHHCPYCLEEVRKNDPRGIEICPDCGTWHHKDCWDITGACQIAHKHELNS